MHDERIVGPSQHEVYGGFAARIIDPDLSADERRRLIRQIKHFNSYADLKGTMH